MTKTYDDIEAVTRLLEEKEKDLELTARIGKELLAANSKLENTVSSLETDLRTALEKITQLSHEVQKKTELIQILTNDMDESLFETGSSGRINLELLQKRMSSLEEENKALHAEYSRLAQETDDVEAQEHRLLKDLTGQLSCANSSMGYLEDELDRQKDENRVQHEHILALKAKLEETEVKLHKFVTENDELTSLLQITKDNQGSLAVELSEFKARYYEMENLLRDAQEQLRKLRRKQMPGARISMFSSLSQPNHVQSDSLQSELEMSYHSELSSDSGCLSSTEALPQYRRVFETVRCASQNSLSCGDRDSSGSLQSGLMGYVSSSSISSSAPRMSCKTQISSLRRPSLYSSSSLGYPSLESTGNSDTESSQTTDSEDNLGGHQRGIPGVPGSADLEAALQRLTPGEVLARRANLQRGSTYNSYESDAYLPYGCRTPDSLMSTGSCNYPGWKLPEKLQIVKPIEGSQTLLQWSQLAQPTFGGLLEERPGVKIRGGKELEDIGLESYGLSDLEEDEEYGNPGKVFDSSAPTYTYTNSTVMHPGDVTFLTPSNRASRMGSVCSSLHNSPPQTPGPLSRRNSCSTFSTTYGLANMLNERGIKAVTPSALNTPHGANSFTPTATPCNSPEFTPSHSRPTSPEPPEVFSIPQLLLQSVPQFLRDTVVGGTKKKYLSKVKCKRRNRNEIERIDISNLMSASGLSLSAGLYARSALTSPMAQLTCLLPGSSTDNLSIIKRKELPCPPPIPVQNKPPISLGVPGIPGSTALSQRLHQLNSRKQRKQANNGSTRPDLGTVGIKKSAETEQKTTLGTLSALLFGRKGGLF